VWEMGLQRPSERISTRCLQNECFHVNKGQFLYTVNYQQNLKRLNLIVNARNVFLLSAI
jgi:hypothetical protein